MSQYISEGYVLSPIEVDGKVVSAMPDTTHPEDRVEEVAVPKKPKAKE